MTLRTGLAALILALDVQAATLNGGTVEIRTGGQPATPATAASGTLLGTLTFGTPAFGGAAAVGNNAAATAAAITDDSDADATGTAGYFRAKTAGGVAVWDGTVTAGGGGGDAIINTVDIQIHSRVRITSMVMTQPM